MNEIESRLTKMEVNQRDVEKAQEQQKLNYVERFKGVELKIKQSENNIIREISDLKAHLTEVFVPKEFCKYVQEQKK